jgi:transglutaminase-like putative cysteine protease
MQKVSARRADWLSAVLLFLIIQVAAARLVTTDWAPYLYFSEILAALGTILGMALGKSQFKRRLVIEFVIGYSAIVLPWQLVKIADKNLELRDRLISVGQILYAAFIQFITRQPVKDSFFFVAFISLVFWLLGLSAGYWLIRHNNLLAAVIPSALAALLIQIYDNYHNYSSWWLAVYILLSLLLLGRDYYRRSQDEWSKNRVVVSEDAWTNIFSSLLTVTAIIVIIAWSIPTSLSSWQSAAAQWNKFTQPIRDRLSNAVTSLDSPYSNGGENFYSDTLDIGRFAATGNTPMFTVKILLGPEFDTRYYWRGRVYDHYDNGLWVTAPASHLDFEPAGGDLKIPNTDNRAGAIVEFTLQLPQQSLLYAPSQPTWINKSGTVTATRVDAQVDDVLSWEANPAIETGTDYQVHAMIANPTVEQLRAASTDYPKWVTDRYLEIPAALEPKFKQLAIQIIADRKTEFDQTEAVTEFLRNNMRYVTDIPPAPNGTDPIEWFLFDYKKGFCNYYASAEVLLLRSAGIPARLAVGFAQGQRQNDSYIVRKRDSHAWPEVYFPGIGWVEFEPTGNQDPLIRSTTSQAPTTENPKPTQIPLSESNTPSEAGQVTPLPAAPVPFEKTPLGISLIVSIPLLLLALVIFVVNRYRLIGRVTLYLTTTWEQTGITAPVWMKNLQRWNQLTPVERAFANINLSLRWLGQPLKMDMTPNERAALLTKLLPSAKEHIEALKFELESELFTPRPANVSRARRAAFFILLHTIGVFFQRIEVFFNGE